MIKIENVNIVGWEAAIWGMRNPMNSWEKSDSVFGTYWGKIDEHECVDNSDFTIGQNDLDLMKKLAYAGTDHRKFMRMIVVYLDITAPLYWWKEFDTYKVGTVANSCSTMHRIAAKEFGLEDFSFDHLKPTSISMLKLIIEMLNDWREQYLVDSDIKKDYWWQLIQLLPSSYNQRRTIMLNYEVLANMYKSRKNHKLDEWVDFCKWIEALPHSELITKEIGINDSRKNHTAL